MMTAVRCVHGMDSRLCSLCNKPQSRSPTLQDIIDFLGEQRIRATYRAVADVLGVTPRMGSRLGDRRPEASWIVNADTGLPTGYQQHDMHPDLLRWSEIIRTGRELSMRMAIWKAGQSV